MIMKFKHLFGPVPSRRLGVSLGIDLVPYKTCTLNCVYCECGKTTNLTIERMEYVPTDEILSELNECLKNSPDPDYVTFSGSGEPTLHNGIGQIIDFLKQNYPQYKVAVLTNGTLFHDKKLRDEVKNADLIIPSLDAGSCEIFKKINRPHEKLDLNEVIEGLAALRKEFPGEIWLEIFIVPGLNDTDPELQKIKNIIQKINPDKIQLNALDRPGTEEWVMPAEKKKLEEIASLLDAEIIAEFKSRKKIKSFSRDIEENIISTLRRRPCTAKDLSEILGIHLNEINKYLQALIETGKINSKEGERGTFFRIK
jgi:wyosine [tRNA(Phe)-imidazoG37] synthetase (radical SAM superfamily)